MLYRFVFVLQKKTKTRMLQMDTIFAIKGAILIKI